MPRSYMLSWLAWIVFTVSSPPVLAQEDHHDSLRIEHAVAAPTPPGAPNGAIYLDISAGSASVSLIDAHTPISDKVETHVTTIKDGTMHMRLLKSLDMGPGDTVRMRPGDGVHLMLLGLKEPLKEGMRFPLTLRFRRGGSMEIEVLVAQPPAGHQHAPVSHHNH